MRATSPSLFLFLSACSTTFTGTAVAFQSAHPRTQTYSSYASSTTQLCAVPLETCLEIGYSTRVAKPLGIVFGENPEPYFGLVVDDVAEGQNGGAAGLRVGDQLMAINGNVVVGMDFDSIMGGLQSASGDLDLVMYRGPVSNMYTIFSNQMSEDDFLRDDEEGDEEIIMDEDYETPVVIEVKERKPLTPGDFFKAAAKVGKMLVEDDTPPEVKQEKKKKSGFFGIGGEAVQLDGEDAKGYK
jgi:hypothetical protein